ncbi:MAG: SH3 domain-containing protein [Wenzhouxiangellaceae bacterium]
MLQRSLWILLLPLAAPGCVSNTPQAPDAVAYQTDVIGVEEAHLSADFWVKRLPSPDAVVMDRAAIDDWNAQSFAADATMADLASYPAHLDGTAVRTMIESLSRRPASERYYEDGRPLIDADFARYEQALNTGALDGTVRTAFGLVVARANMRTFPTRDRVFNAVPAGDLDRFQEHALFPGEGVVVLHQSAAGDWLFVQSYNYAGWVAAEGIALTDRQTMLDYLSAPDFVVVTGSKITTAYNPHVAAVSELQIDMGVRLPRVHPAEAGNNVHGQNPFASYIVRLPVRADDGSLRLELALLPRNRGVSVGYLPYTRENVIRQAFEFLGERYGWGHSYNARDCTGFVSEVYKTFGLLMPRNSGDQGKSDIGGNQRFDADAADTQKTAALRALDPGSLVYLPGHVMMHIGNIDGEPYIIHDVYGLGYETEDGSYYRGVLAGVSVTPLLPLRLSAETSYVDRIYNIKTIQANGANQ